MNYLEEALWRIEGNIDQSSNGIKDATETLVVEIRAVLKGDVDGCTKMMELRNGLLRMVTGVSPKDLGRKTSYATTAAMCAADAVRFAVNGKKTVAKSQAENAYEFAKVANGGS